MAIRHSITLSTSEPNNEVGNLKIRQGDEQTQTLVANITENGVPKPFVGLQPFFCAKLGQTAGLGIIEQKVTGTMNPANGTLEYVMQPEDWQQLGRQTAYFSFRKMVNDHEWTEQFSTRDFNYNVIKSAFSEGLREVKKDGSTYVWTIEDMLRLFKEYMASGKTDWEEFVEQNREILESVDPGGKLIGELIEARRPSGGEAYATLGERLDEADAHVLKNSKNRINVKSFNAIGDGLTDDTEALNLAFASGKPLYFPKGIYLYNGKIDLKTMPTNTPDWLGDGSWHSVIKFTNPEVRNLVERQDCIGVGWKLKGLKFRGLGKSVTMSDGTKINGLWSQYGTESQVSMVNQSYDLHFDDVAVTDVSGNGFQVTDWFQQYWRGCYARNIGGNGFIIGGDQYTSFINSANFNLNIDGYSWWFQTGSPFLQALNCGNVFGGLRLGRPSTHPRGIAFCSPSIFGLNVEPLFEGGVGIRVENGSRIIESSDIKFYSPKGSVNAEYGVYFDYLNDSSVFNTPIAFIKYDSTYADFDNKYHVAGAGSDGQLVFYKKINNEFFNSVALGKALFLKSEQVANGNAFSPEHLIINRSLSNYGAVRIRAKKVMTNLNIRRDSGTQDDNILLVDATNGNVTISLDYASYLNNRTFTIKRIDSSANIVTIASLGGVFDGKVNITLAQYDAVRLISYDGKWHLI